MTKKSKAKTKEPDTIILEIEACKSSYFISEKSCDDGLEFHKKADDEYVLDIACKIIHMPKRLSKQHLGHDCEFSLLSANEYSKKFGVCEEAYPVFFGTMRFSGQCRTGLAYVPSSRLQFIEQQIRSLVFRYIEVRSEYLKRGYGGIQWIYIAETNPISTEAEE